MGYTYFDHRHYADYYGTALSLSVGKQAANWFLGFGAGYFWASNDSKSNYDYREEMVDSFKSFPVYLYGRKYIGKRKFAPFIDLKLGARFCHMYFLDGHQNKDVLAFAETAAGFSIGAFALGISYDFGAYFDGPVRCGIDSPALRISLQF